MWVAHFGGSFNPVHTGHIAIGRCLLDRYFFDRVVYTPNSSHYPKPGLAAEADRLALLQTATMDEPRFEVSEYELGKATWTEPVETLMYLKEQYMQKAESIRMFTIRGDDWLPEIFKWTNEIAEHEGLYEFVFVPRVNPNLQEISINAEQADLISRMSYIMKCQEVLDVSSSLVRAYIKSGETHNLPLPAGVLNQIRQLGLYEIDTWKD